MGTRRMLHGLERTKRGVETFALHYITEAVQLFSCSKLGILRRRARFFLRGGEKDAPWAGKA